MKFLIPLVVFAVMSAFLVKGLGRDPRLIPSPLIDRAAPAFRQPLLREPAKTLGSSDLRGRVWLVNVWASWCVACRAEHEVLNSVSRSGVPVLGVDYRDEPEPALAFLSEFGDPYAVTIQDPEGRLGIDYGVYGVPETYVVDSDGVIRYKHVGALTNEIVGRDILPLVARLQR